MATNRQNQKSDFKPTARQNQKSDFKLTAVEALIIQSFREKNIGLDKIVEIALKIEANRE